MRNDTSQSSPHKIHLQDSESTMKVTPANVASNKQVLSNPVDLLSINKNKFSSKSNHNRSIYTDFCDTDSQLSQSQLH